MDVFTRKRIITDLHTGRPVRFQKDGKCTDSIGEPARKGNRVWRKKSQHRENLRSGDATEFWENDRSYYSSNDAARPRAIDGRSPLNHYYSNDAARPQENDRSPHRYNSTETSRPREAHVDGRSPLNRYYSNDAARQQENDRSPHRYNSTETSRPREAHVDGRSPLNRYYSNDAARPQENDRSRHRYNSTESSRSLEVDGRSPINCYNNADGASVQKNGRSPLNRYNSADEARFQKNGRSPLNRYISADEAIPQNGRSPLNRYNSADEARPQNGRSPLNRYNSTDAARPQENGRTSCYRYNSRTETMRPWKSSSTPLNRYNSIDAMRPRENASSHSRKINTDRVRTWENLGSSLHCHSRSLTQSDWSNGNDHSSEVVNPGPSHTSRIQEAQSLSSDNPDVVRQDLRQKLTGFTESRLLIKHSANELEPHQALSKKRKRVETGEDGAIKPPAKRIKLLEDCAQTDCELLPCDWEDELDLNKPLSDGTWEDELDLNEPLSDGTWGGFRPSSDKSVS